MNGGGTERILVRTAADWKIVQAGHCRQPVALNRAAGQDNGGSLALAAAASCSAIDTGDFAVRPRVGQGDPGLGPTPATGIPRPDSTGINAGPESGLVRRVCRASGWPRDWIATAYEDAAGECPLSVGVDSVAVAALIVALAGQPIGAVLDVCADQPLPSRWELVRDERVEMVQRCPGAGRDGASAMRRIRRIR